MKQLLAPNYYALTLLAWQIISCFWKNGILCCKFRYNHGDCKTVFPEYFKVYDFAHSKEWFLFGKLNYSAHQI